MKQTLQMVRKYGFSSIKFKAGVLPPDEEIETIKQLRRALGPKVPLRIVTFCGFASSLICILVAVLYFVYKLLFWNNFSVGIAPLPNARNTNGRVSPPALNPQAAVMPSTYA